MIRTGEDDDDVAVGASDRNRKGQTDCNQNKTPKLGFGRRVFVAFLTFSL